MFMFKILYKKLSLTNTENLLKVGHKKYGKFLMNNYDRNEIPYDMNETRRF